MKLLDSIEFEIPEKEEGLCPEQQAFLPHLQMLSTEEYLEFYSKVIETGKIENYLKFFSFHISPDLYEMLIDVLIEFRDQNPDWQKETTWLIWNLNHIYYVKYQKFCVQVDREPVDLKRFFEHFNVYDFYLYKHLVFEKSDVERFDTHAYDLINKLMSGEKIRFDESLNSANLSIYVKFLYTLFRLVIINKSDSIDIEQLLENTKKLIDYYLESDTIFFGKMRIQSLISAYYSMTIKMKIDQEGKEAALYLVDDFCKTISAMEKYLPNMNTQVLFRYMKSVIEIQNFYNILGADDNIYDLYLRANRALIRELEVHYSFLDLQEGLEIDHGLRSLNPRPDYWPVESAMYFIGHAIFFARDYSTSMGKIINESMNLFKFYAENQKDKSYNFEDAWNFGLDYIV